MMADLVDHDVADELLEADPGLLPLGDDRPPEERHPFGQPSRLLDALVIEWHTLVKAAELHRVAKAEAPGGIRIRDFIDLENDVAKTLREGRGQAIERSPRNRLDVGGARDSSRKALCWSHALELGTLVTARNLAPCVLAP